MKQRFTKENDGKIDQRSVALVANADGSLDLLMPHDARFEPCPAQILISALALRCSEDAWAEEQIDFLDDVRRRLDEPAAPAQLNRG